MAGVKGRSGGARKGAGRPKKEIKPAPATKEADPLTLLMRIANDPDWDPTLRVRAAVEASKIMYSEDGKKAQAGKRAGSVASTDRLSGIAPPGLKVVPK